MYIESLHLSVPINISQLVNMSFDLWQAAGLVQHEGGRQKQLPNKIGMHKQGAQDWSKALSLLHAEYVALRMHAA